MEEIKIAEGVYTRKSKWFRYRLIFPNKNSDGTINWFNLLTGGSWGNVIGVAVIVLVMIGLVLAYKHDVAALVECCNKCTNLLNIQTTPTNFSIDLLHP